MNLKKENKLVDDYNEMEENIFTFLKIKMLTSLVSLRKDDMSSWNNLSICCVLFKFQSRYQREDIGSQVTYDKLSATSTPEEQSGDL